MSLAGLAGGAETVGVSPEVLKGIGCLTDVTTLPFLKKGVKIRFTGSMAKDGGNADWDWWLYQDKTSGEWVIFEEDGPGCIHHFYNHRRHPGYSRSERDKPYAGPDTVYRFYFDGAKEPQFQIKASEFGKLAGFEEPLTDMYQNWVKRTWFPMFFRRGCKITTSDRLRGANPGGWGGVVGHSYSDTDGVPDFAWSLDHRAGVRQLLLTPKGIDPKPTDGNLVRDKTLLIEPGETQTVLEESGEASFSSVRIALSPYSPTWIEKLRLLIWFDDYSRPTVDVPLAGFFGNTIGRTTTQMVMQGVQIDVKDGSQAVFSGYSFFPMPFWRRARIAVSAPEDFPSGITLSLTAEIRPASKTRYPKESCGYFHAVSRAPATPAQYDDVEYAVLRGTGHMVQGSFSAWSTCESDFHFYADGNATPALESDGAESWAGFGWGFVGPYSGTVTCQDAAPQRGRRATLSGNQNDFCGRWGMTRTLLADFYPFYGQLVVRQENAVREVRKNERTFMAPGDNDYQGVVLFYGVNRDSIRMTDTIDIGNEGSEKSHNYACGQSETVSLTSRYEGGNAGHGVLSGGLVAGEVADTGRAIKEFSEFTVAISPQNAGVMLRRRSDQQFGRQRARVLVDGTPVSERTWYRADRNPVFRWLDDEFEIPAKYAAGKSKLRVRLEFLPASDATPQQFPGDAPAASWSEYRYQVFSR